MAKRPGKDLMPCYRCNATGTIEVVENGRKVRVKCPSCEGKGGWPRH